MTRHMRLRRAAAGAILALFIASPAAADERAFTQAIEDRVTLCNERPVACEPPKPARKKSTPPPTTVKTSVTDSGGIWKTATSSYYGPGLYGNTVGCKPYPILTPGTIGVAHKTLPCWSSVTFRKNGVEVTAKVIDRGPYVGGRMWDLTEALCRKLNHCQTGPIEYKLG